MVRCRTAASADRGEPGKRRAPAGKARSCCPRRAATAVPGPPKRISKEVRTAIEGMLSGDCRRIGDAARKIGLALKTLSRALSKPHVAEPVRQQVLRSLAIAAPAPQGSNYSTAPPNLPAIAPRASSWALPASSPPATRPFRSIPTSAPLSRFGFLHMADI
jgi:hypothetical protein